MSATAARRVAGCACRARWPTGSVETDGGITTFTIVFGDAAIPVRYDGEPGGIFAECEPVVVHGRLVDGVFEGDQIEVKHSNEYEAENPERVDADRADCPVAEA